jgi:hypothetical protein
MDLRIYIFFDFFDFWDFSFTVAREGHRRMVVGFSGFRNAPAVEKQKLHRQHREEAALGSYSARPYITTTISLVLFFCSFSPHNYRCC